VNKLAEAHIELHSEVICMKLIVLVLQRHVVLKDRARYVAMCRVWRNHQPA